MSGAQRREFSVQGSESSVQSPGSSIQSPVSRVQRPESRNPGMPNKLSFIFKQFWPFTTVTFFELSLILTKFNVPFKISLQKYLYNSNFS